MDYSREFTNFIKKDKDFLKAYEIVKKNGKGKVWLIGGNVSRNLSSIIHKEKKKISNDFDFIVEEINDNFEFPKGAKVKKNTFGNMKLEFEGLSIDIIPSKKISYLNKHNLEFSIEEFLKGTLFTIQAIAYEIKEEKLIDSGCIGAIKNKVFEIYNLEEAEYYVKKKGYTLKDWMKIKAKSMGYKVKL